MLKKKVVTTTTRISRLLLLMVMIGDDEKLTFRESRKKQLREEEQESDIESSEELRNVTYPGAYSDHTTGYNNDSNNADHDNDADTITGNTVVDVDGQQQESHSGFVEARIVDRAELRRELELEDQSELIHTAEVVAVVHGVDDKAETEGRRNCNNRVCICSLLLLAAVAAIVLGVVVGLRASKADSNSTVTSPPITAVNNSVTASAPEPSPAPMLLDDWVNCSSSIQCISDCCSSKYSDDGVLKCSPGGFNSDTCVLEGNSTVILGDWLPCSSSSQCINDCCSSEYSDGVLKCTPGVGFNPDICVLDGNSTVTSPPTEVTTSVTSSAPTIDGTCEERCQGVATGVPVVENGSELKAVIKEHLKNASSSPYGSYINCWDISQVTDLSGVFSYELEGGDPVFSVFNGPLDCWDTSQCPDHGVNVQWCPQF